MAVGATVGAEATCNLFNQVNDRCGGAGGRATPSCGSSTMPLTLEKLKELQEEALADDCEIDMDRMKSWSESQAQ